MRLFNYVRNFMSGLGTMKGDSLELAIENLNKEKSMVCEVKKNYLNKKT